LVTESTETFGSAARGEKPRVVAWTLTVALDCERLSAAPRRIALERVVEVEIGRGADRAYRVGGTRMRIDLADRWTSQIHARLTRSGDGWAVEDTRSKNGVRVNGRPVESAALADRDVLECGCTFFVLRRTDGAVVDLELPAPPKQGLWTLSPALEREFAVLGKIARSRVPVIVRGASGTGKEVVASAIHALSGRSGPMVAVNCGAIPATLIESTLFGSRRGAFSGAEDRAGLVRSAEYGTLFLDEVAELPVASQAALLRVLQEGEVLPLGASKALSVDVRVIAATNRPMDYLVAAERFRGDLYARLRGHEVHLPPLRDRLEDLGFLIASILERIDPGGTHRSLTRTAARAMFLHRWPANVRELDHVLHTAIAVASGPEIGVEDLRLAAPTPEPPDAGPVGGEREQLVALLQKHGGNLNAVARDLATSRSQVRRLLARHGLQRAEYQPPKRR